MEMMAQAMIRGVMDESGEQFVAYFLPTDETLEKRQEDFRKVTLCCFLILSQNYETDKYGMHLSKKQQTKI